MFEFLIVEETSGGPKYRIVELSGLLDEVQKALDDDGYCICVYEIHRRVFDWSLPRNQVEGREQNGKKG